GRGEDGAMSMIRIERDGAVAVLVLDRPEAANVLDLDGARALRAAVAEVAADDQVRAVLLHGSGPRFCGGGDLASMAVAADPTSHLRELAGLADEVVRALCDLPKPVV